MISNCLFEALKAKIKDPKNVQIHVFPASVNGHGLVPHFWWSVGDTGYDFKKESNTKQNLLFKGRIRSYKKSIYEEQLRDLYRKAVNEKYLKKGIDLFGELTWHEGRPTGNEARHFYIEYIESGVAKVRLVSKEDLDYYKNIESWRAGNDIETDNILLNAAYNEDNFEFK